MFENVWREIFEELSRFSVVALRSCGPGVPTSHELERYARGPRASLIRVEQKKSHQEEKQERETAKREGRRPPV